MPTTKAWTEQDMRADLVKVWGEHGAHVTMFDWILSMNADLEMQVADLRYRLEAIYD